MENRTEKLTLKKETLRNLQPAQFTSIEGGVSPTFIYAAVAIVAASVMFCAPAPAGSGPVPPPAVNPTQGGDYPTIKTSEAYA